MPIYSLKNNYVPTLFNTGSGNCYAYFNNAFNLLEEFFDMCIVKEDAGITTSGRNITGNEAGALLGDIFAGFYAAYTLLCEDDRNAAEYRFIFMQYAFAAALLESPATAAWFYEQNAARWLSALQQQDDEADIYAPIAAACKDIGSYATINVKDVRGVANLIIYAAKMRGLVRLIDENFAPVHLDASGFLLRFILHASPDDSVLLEKVDWFSMQHVPIETVFSRPLLFQSILKRVAEKGGGIFNHGALHILNALLVYHNKLNQQQGNIDIFYQGYNNYEKLGKEACVILDDNADSFLLYYLYGGAPRGQTLPQSPHFAHLHKEFIANANFYEIVSRYFNKYNFSKHEVDLCTEIADPSGFLSACLDQLYSVDAIHGYAGTAKLRFAFENYPAEIIADYSQFSETTVNYYWLPEQPAAVLDENGNEFISPILFTKQRRTHSSILRQSGAGTNDDTGFTALTPTFRKLFLYGYAYNFIKSGHIGTMPYEAAAYREMVVNLRNMPPDISIPAARQVVLNAKANGDADTAYMASRQLAFISPTLATLRFFSYVNKQHASAAFTFGDHILNIIETLDISGDELYKALGDDDHRELISTLINRTQNSIYYNNEIAKNLHRLNRELTADEIVYLNSSYVDHNFKPAGGTKHETILKYNKDIDTDTRLLLMFLENKLINREFDTEFNDAFAKLWDAVFGQHDKLKSNDIARDGAHAIIWRVLAYGDSPKFAFFTKYIEAFNEAADSAVLYEFVLFNKIQNKQPITRAESDRMFLLYKAQMIVTARTLAVATTIGAANPSAHRFAPQLAAELLAYEWIDADARWKSLTVTNLPYGEFLLDEKNASYTGLGVVLQNDAPIYTYVRKIGYENIYKLRYREDGVERTDVFVRNFGRATWLREYIFTRMLNFAKERGNNDLDANMPLIAGRICVDGDVFNGDVLLAYVDYLISEAAASSNIHLLELTRALKYITAESSQNSFTKYCLFATKNGAFVDKLKRLLTIILLYWPEIKANTDLRKFIAFIRSLERVCGANKLGNLSDYLFEQIQQNPHIQPDLREVFRTEYVNM
ncbi:MAG: hypothetical protein FWC95_02030 [Defluviitaleaceae bacterium]|nr:hypothetical protein [Defluviitaleaceae bacterium]